MMWGYQPGMEKVHCYVLMDNPNLFVSLCNGSVSFIINPINEDPQDHINICFNCLLEFIRKGEVKP